MKIAVCDDDLAAREQVATFLENYMLERRTDIDYELFDHYEKLMDRISEFDVFIMDYQMPDIDGLEFARMIRDEYNSTKAIIFVSSYKDIVYDTFEVRTHRFLPKPLNQVKLFEAIDSCINSRFGDKFITVKYEGVTNIINISDIYYIEVLKKDCIICFENRQITVHKPISFFEEELGESGFFRAHRSYLINLRKIQSFDNSHALLKNGETVDVSSRRYRDLCREYLKIK